MAKVPMDPQFARLIAIAASLISLPAIVLTVFFLMKGCAAE